MNDLEKAVMRSAQNAEKTYEEMADGQWLSHGPESFLQITVARRLRKLGNFIYVDASIKKTQRDIERSRRGRRPHNLGQRPDISVWFKATNRLRAVIEIKRATWGDFGPVAKDAKKIEKLILQKHSSTGYLLIYSEAKGEQRRKKLKNRFRKWAEKLHWKLVQSFASTSGNEVWAWGFALFRFTLPKSN